MLYFQMLIIIVDVNVFTDKRNILIRILESFVTIFLFIYKNNSIKSGLNYQKT